MINARHVSPVLFHNYAGIPLRQKRFGQFVRYMTLESDLDPRCDHHFASLRRVKDR